LTQEKLIRHQVDTLPRSEIENPPTRKEAKQRKKSQRGKKEIKRVRRDKKRKTENVREGLLETKNLKTTEFNSAVRGHGAGKKRRSQAYKRFGEREHRIAKKTTGFKSRKRD